MKLILSIVIIVNLFFTSPLTAQNDWNGRKCAICLSYDDAMDSQLDNVYPQLKKYGLKGTFYLKGSSPAIYHRMDEWKSLAAGGNELGNHTIFHPCSGTRFPDREKDRDLDYYTIKRFLSEVEVANTLLKALDGKNERTFAYTCGDRTVEGKDMGTFLPKYVSGARGGGPIREKKNNIDLFSLPSVSCTGKTGEKMIEIIKETMNSEGLTVLVFHGVGGGHLKVDTDEHEKLLRFLKENEQDIWVAPVIDVVNYLKSE